MLTVETDPVVVEQRLGAGGWCVRVARVGWPAGVSSEPACSRPGRAVDGAPRRARCSPVPGDPCAVTGGVAGQAGGHGCGDRGCVDREGGRAGHRRIAAALGRAPDTVRGWLRRFAARAEPVRAVFTGGVGSWTRTRCCPARPGTAWADALAAIHAAVRAVHARFGAPDDDALAGVVVVPVWQVAVAVSAGRLLAPGWPDPTA